MIDCLRGRKVAELTSVQLNVPHHLTAFGPIIDSIVVPFDPRRLYTAEWHRRTLENQSEPQLELGHAYDLLLGGTDIDLPCIFSEEEVTSGVEPERRNRILRTLVRNLYDYHQQVCFVPFPTTD